MAPAPTSNTEHTRARRALKGHAQGVDLGSLLATIHQALVEANLERATANDLRLACVFDSLNPHLETLGIARLAMVSCRCLAETDAGLGAVGRIVAFRLGRRYYSGHGEQSRKELERALKMLVGRNSIGMGDDPSLQLTLSWSKERPETHSLHLVEAGVRKIVAACVGAEVARVQAQALSGDHVGVGSARRMGRL